MMTLFETISTILLVITSIVAPIIAYLRKQFSLHSDELGRVQDAFQKHDLQIKEMREDLCDIKTQVLQVSEDYKKAIKEMVENFNESVNKLASTIEKINDKTTNNEKEIAVIKAKMDLK